MRIWGQFRDLDVDNNFVWMRGYRTMEERKEGLFGFYTSDIWKETSPQLGEWFAENPTHIHFLEPVSPGAGLDDAFERSDVVRSAGVVVAQMFRAEESYAPVVRLPPLPASALTPACAAGTSNRAPPTHSPAARSGPAPAPARSRSCSAHTATRRHPSHRPCSS